MVAGIIALLLAAASLVAGIVNRMSPFIHVRFRWFAVVFLILLVIGIFLLLRRRTSGAGGAPPASR
jgi:hypothetical protein